jgi:hypothetical protein
MMGAFWATKVKLTGDSMTQGIRIQGLMASLWLALSGVAMATPGPTPAAGDVHGLADESCDAKCDDQSDKCMKEAGNDSSKKQQCDAKYEECLRSCG